MTDIITRAIALATERHAGQVRKGTQVPYTEHLRAVAEMVAATGAEPYVVAAAWLHDVLEDTQTTAAELTELFGHQVSYLVVELTDLYTPQPGMNRALRKQLERERLATVSDEAQTVKLADMIDNTAAIGGLEPRFRSLYLTEKDALVRVLTRAHPALREDYDHQRDGLKGSPNPAVSAANSARKGTRYNKSK